MNRISKIEPGKTKENIQYYKLHIIGKVPNSLKIKYKN